MNIYNYFLTFITIFAFYEMLFFYIIRPYYVKKLAQKHNAKTKIPEVAFEVVYLLILVLGLLVARVVDVSPFLLWGIIILVYGFAIKRSRQSFFLASALIFKFHRDLSIEQQLENQANLIFGICIVSGFAFIVSSYFIL